MTGVHQPDRGLILLAGRPVTIRSAAEAQRLGIAAIYQEPLLFPDLNVAENIFISHQDRGTVVDWRGMFREAEAILAELGVALDVRSPARGLTLAAQQSVEIAKAISLNVRILIMDEPTASLSAHEVQELFKLVRDLKRQGVAILFVSHRLEEVFEIADKVTVFRDGRLDIDASSPRGDAAARDRRHGRPRNRLDEDAGDGGAKGSGSVGVRSRSPRACSRASPSISIAARSSASPA